MIRYLLMAMSLFALLGFSNLGPVQNALAKKKISKQCKGKKKKSKKCNKGNKGNKKDIDNGIKGTSCGDKQVLFTRSPLDTDDLRSIIPLGNFNPAGHSLPTKHFYMHLRREVEMDYNTNSALSSVYAPADMKIIQLNSSSSPGFNIIYSIVFSPCKEVTGYFLHVTGLSTELKELLEAQQICETHEAGTSFERKVCFTKELEYEVKVGDLLGYAGGDDENNELDFGLFDTRIKSLTVGNEKRWTDVDPVQHHRKTVCALDYYGDELKTQLESYLGYFENKRTIEPLCSSVDYDIPGTASGMWFSSKSSAGPYPETNHMTLAYDVINPKIALFSIGIVLANLEPGVFMFDPLETGSINRDFKDIKADGKTYCYETHPGSLGQYNNSTTKVFLIKLSDKQTLRIEHIEAESCSSFNFGSNAVDMIR